MSGWKKVAAKFGVGAAASTSDKYVPMAMVQRTESASTLGTTRTAGESGTLSPSAIKARLAAINAANGSVAGGEMDEPSIRSGITFVAADGSIRAGALNMMDRRGSDAGSSIRGGSLRNGSAVSVQLASLALERAASKDKAKKGSGERSASRRRIAFAAAPVTDRPNWVPVFHPNSRVLVYWGYVIVAALVYAFFALPFRIAFADESFAFGGLGILDVLVDGVFLLDLVLDFNVAFIEADGYLEQSRRRIAARLWRQYRRRTFVKLLCTEFIYWIACGLGTGWIVRGAAQLPSFARLGELFAFFRTREQDYHVDVRKPEMLKFILIILGSGHWVGCLWYLIVRLELFDPRSWLVQYETDGVEPNFARATANTFDLYLRSLLWGFNGVSSLGYMDWIPATYPEVIFCIFVMFVAMLLQSYVITIVMSYLIVKDPKAQVYRDKMHALERYMQMRSLSPDLCAQLRSYFKLQAQVASSESAGGFLESYPENLRIAVASYLYMSVIAQATMGGNKNIFNGCEEHFISVICLHLKHIYILHGDEILRENDSARELMFIKSGEVELWHGGELVRTMTAGVVGELAFFVGIKQPYRVKAHAKNNVHLLSLGKDDYEELLRSYPEQHDRIVSTILRRFHIDSRSAGIDDAGSFSSFAVDEMDADDLRVKDLLEKQLEASQEEALGAVTYAASKGELDEVKRLVLRGLNVDAGDYDNRTVLHLAAAEGNMKVVDFLIQQGADVNIQDRWGHVPLQDAIRYKHDAIAQLLVSKGAILPRADAAMQCQRAAAAGDVKQLGRLIENGVDPNLPDYDGRTALHIASAEGNLAVVQYLISVKANVNCIDRWNTTPLEDAIRNHHELVAFLLKEHGGVITLEDPAYEMCTAASEGDVNKLRLFVSCGVDVDVGDYDRRTALHLAASEGQLEVVEELLHLTANVNCRDRFGGTPLDDALRKGHDMVAALLIARGGMAGEDMDRGGAPDPIARGVDSRALGGADLRGELEKARSIMRERKRVRDEEKRQRARNYARDQFVKKVADVQKRVDTVMEIARQVMKERQYNKYIDSIQQKMDRIVDFLRVINKDAMEVVQQEREQRRRRAAAPLLEPGFGRAGSVGVQTARTGAEGRGSVVSLQAPRSSGAQLQAAGSHSSAASAAFAAASSAAAASASASAGPGAPPAPSVSSSGASGSLPGSVSVS